MTYQELNQYILHYLTKDKTKSAIMLTAPWGTGKSYYIQNELKPFLEKEENGSHKCLVVSLYGLKDVSEISKALFIECLPRFLSKNPKKAAVGQSVATTVIKGVTSFFGIDLSKSEEEMETLYNCVDLSGKLVILEDLERSGIDIIKVLGYVNNLVEQDGVKVLLVANEEEIIKYKFRDRLIGQRQKDDIVEEQGLRAACKTSIKNDADIMISQSSENYLRAKEKTISDTIQFEEDYTKAIKDIIQSFDDSTLSKFTNSDSIKDILNAMGACRVYNLRSFIFACQKTSDIFNKLVDSEYLSKDKFIQAIFFGILSFVLKQKTGNTKGWGKERYFSVELGNEGAPLFKFCYDYITRQIDEFDDIEGACQAYEELVLYDSDRSSNDKDIITLQNYYIHTESDVVNAVESLKKRLKNPEDISFYQYGTIAVSTITLKENLDLDINEIKRLLVENLKGRGNKLQLEQIFRTTMSDDCTIVQKEEYESLRKEMAQALKIGVESIPNFDYRPEQSAIFCKYITENEGRFHVQNSLAKQLDMKRLSEMFRGCTAEQKQQFRKAFFEMYGPANIRSFLADDRENLTILLDYIKADNKNDVGDKIQRLQYRYFIQNLTEIIKSPLNPRQKAGRTE